MEFLDETEFDRLGVFTYSREEGTPAADFENQVDEETATRWRDEIMELQQEISADINEDLTGKTFRVVIEGYSPEEGVYVGRTYRDAPGVDGLIFIDTDRELISGTFVDAVIKETGPYDMIAELL
jgi:ribosomal protein S12 methylthiotransferase